MAVFRRRNPEDQDQVSGVNAQNQPPQQYGDSDTDQPSQDPQYQGTTTNQPSQDPQYQETTRNQQYQDPQYQDPGATQQQQYQGPPYQDPGATQQQQYQGPQYQGTGRNQQDQDPQYQETERNEQYQNQQQEPRYQDTARNQQYQDSRYQGTAGDQQHERAITANRQARIARSAMLAPRGLPGGWIGEIVLGLAVVVLGLIVAAHPMHSLNVLSILLGVALIVAGVYHVVRSMRRAGDHRMWGGIAGVLFFLVGIWLIRHVSITVTLIALFTAFAFIIAGISALAEAVSGHGPLGRIWSAILGVICVLAGVAALVTPIHTLFRLAIVLGWSLFAIGVLHIIGGFVSRHDLREESRMERELISVPGQRSTEPADVEGAHGAPAEAHAGASAGAPRHRRSRL